jgi:DNA-binding MarR family transcriptional regulator
MVSKRGMGGDRAEEPGGADTPEVESVRCSLVALRRLFQRRELAEMWASTFGDRARLDYGDLRLLDAVRVAQSSQVDAGATVGAMSQLLGIDPSRASRQVASAVSKGLLLRQAAQGDGRKVVLKITASGERLLAKGSAVSRSRIALALDAWPDSERKRLAGLLDRFVQQLLLESPALSVKGKRRG